MKFRISATLALLVTAVFVMLALAGDSDEFTYLPFVARAQNTLTVTPTSTAVPLPTASNTPQPTNTSIPTNTPMPTATPTVSPSDIRLTFIEYDPPGNDVDGEFVRIRNFGGTAQNMTNWMLSDESNHEYTFPNFTLQAGATVQVWTGSGSDNASNLYWGSGAAIWNNNGDTATLYNNTGALIDICSYAGGGQNTAC